MSESRAVQFMGGMHHFFFEGRRGVTYEGDVITQLHRKAACGFDAGIGKQADDDHMGDALLLQLKVQIGIGEPALAPVLLNDDVAALRHEVRVPLTAPCALGKGVALLNQALGRVGVVQLS